MQVFEHSDPDALTLRSHPWSGSLSDSGHRYYDLRQEPELIRTGLEDLRAWERYPAIETFYRLLEWLNGSESGVETNDCAFSGPSTNEVAGFDKALGCSGRLMLLFRDLPMNTDADRVHNFTNGLARALSQQDEGFEWGVVGATIVPVRFTALPGPDAEKLGSQLMLSFWAWGDDEGEVMANLHRTFVDIESALRGIVALPIRG